MSNKISVLVVDDSETARKVVRKILESDKEIEVIGEAHDGQQAIDLTAKLKPDVITMDISMPKIDGLAATIQIMAYNPTPIVILTTSDIRVGMKRTFEALEAGALEVYEKPRDLKANNSHFIKMVKMISKIKVVTHIAGKRYANQRFSNGTDNSYVVLIAASTGGPSALKTVLTEIDSNINASILVVQHIAEDFIPGFIDWLSQQSSLKLREARDGEKLRKGMVLVCPAGLHVKIMADKTVKLIDLPALNGVKPSADILFYSAAEVLGPKAIGVVLTGMGSDGAEGLLQIKRHGGVTVAQDEKTSVVFGIPKRAIELEAAGKVLPLKEIAKYINSLAGRVK